MSNIHALILIAFAPLFALTTILDAAERTIPEGKDWVQSEDAYRGFAEAQERFATTSIPRDVSIVSLITVGSIYAKEAFPLHKAAARGDTERVEALLLSGANPNQKDNGGMTPLHWAAEHGHPAIVKIITDYLARETMLLLLGALHSRLGANSFMKDVPQSVFRDMRQWIKGWVDQQNDHGETPLHCASKNGDPTIIRILIDNGADVNKRANNKWTPLHFAAANGHLEAVQILLNAGADAQLVNKAGRKPIDEAVLGGKPNAAPLLFR